MLNKFYFNNKHFKVFHCVESVHVWGSCGQYFPAFGLNTDMQIREKTDRKKSEFGSFSRHCFSCYMLRNEKFWFKECSKKTWTDAAHFKFADIGLRMFKVKFIFRVVVLTLPFFCSHSNLGKIIKSGLHYII